MPQPAIPVEGGGLFPVRRIFCVAQNYAAHAREMGADPTREAPFFFTKPADAVITMELGREGRFAYPLATRQIEHEVELVVALRDGGVNLAPAQAVDCIYGYAVGLDMTRRDLQRDAREKGRPWDTAKAFDESAPLSVIRPMPGRILATGEIALKVNGDVRQRGDISQMIWDVPETIACLSRFFRLQAGDLIFTGTPAGIGAVQRGDHLHGWIDGVGELKLVVTPAEFF